MAEQEQRRVVHIACFHANGVMISLLKEDRGTDGALVRDGVAIRLNGPPSSVLMGGTNSPSTSDGPPGLTELDADWWARWVKQNEGKNPLLDMGVIREWTENPTSGPS